MSSVEAVIFDKDGTLFDFATTWEAWAVAFLQRLAPDPDVARTLGVAIGFDLEARTFARDSVAIAGTPLEVAEALASELPSVSMSELVALINAEAACAPQIEAVPLRPYLHGLRARGLSLGVVTNDAEAPARAHLSTAGVLELFDFVAGCDTGYGAKPEAGQLLACARTFEVEPGSVTMVGDSTHDLIAAQRAGMRGVGVLTGLADAADLAPMAEVVLPDIGHLPAWLDGVSTAPDI